MLQNGLRKQSVDIVKTVALGNIDKALELTDQYLEHIEQEKNNAAETVKSAKAILENKDNNLIKICITACDRLITSLSRAAANGRMIKNMLIEMKEKFF